jgi:hypothetical protein
MPAAPRAAQRGTTLILALMIAVLLITITCDIASVAITERESARNAILDLRLEYALKSGLELAKAALVDDAENSGEVDSLLEAWASPEGMQKDLKPESVSGAYTTNTPSEKTRPLRVRVFIEDEDRKWPLPLLTLGSDAQKERRKQGLINVIESFRNHTRGDVPSDLAQLYADAIQAFVTRKEGDVGFGPTPRPPTKSGLPLDVVDLALIPGIPRSLIFDQVDPDDGTIIPGLMHFVTLWSDLQINVNTAPEAVLRGLFRRIDTEAIVGSNIFHKRDERQKELAAEAETRRRLGSESGTGATGRGTGSSAESGTAGEEPVGAFESLEDLRQQVPTLTESLFSEVRNQLTVKSKVFSVWVEARSGDSLRVRRYVLRRDGARFVMILSQPVSYPRYRAMSDEELQAESEET